MSKVLEVLFLDFLWYLKYLTPLFFPLKMTVKYLKIDQVLDRNQVLSALKILHVGEDISSRGFFFFFFRLFWWRISSIFFFFFGGLGSNVYRGGGGAVKGEICGKPPFFCFSRGGVQGFKQPAPTIRWFCMRQSLFLCMKN